MVERLARAYETLLLIAGSLELEAHAIEDVALGIREARLERVGIVRGVASAWQRHDADLEAALVRELHTAERRRLACRIRVEAQVEAAGQALQLLQLSLGERGAHRRHHGLEADLAERDYVRVSLDDDAA